MSACSNTFHGENNAIGQRVASIYCNESLGPDSGDVTTWLYDEASGSMTNKVYADGKGPTYSYTPDGKLSRRVWARGVVTDYAYDCWGSLTNTVYSDDTPTVSIAYDVHGRQIEARDAVGLYLFLKNYPCAYDYLGLTGVCCEDFRRNVDTSGGGKTGESQILYMLLGLQRDIAGENEGSELIDTVKLIQ